jgi:hypothetical protein
MMLSFIRLCHQLVDMVFKFIVGLP